MLLHDLGERRPRGRSASASPARVIGDAELPRDGRPAQVGVDQQHALVRAARQRAGEVDGRHRLAVAGRRAGDRDHLRLARAREAFDRQPQALILLGGERGGRREADQTASSTLRASSGFAGAVTVRMAMSPQKAIIRDELLVAAGDVGGSRGDERDGGQRRDGGERRLQSCRRRRRARSAESRRAPARS